MNNVLNNRIKAFKGLVDRMAHPKLVMDELQEIFKAIDEEKNPEVKESALETLKGITAEFLKESMGSGILSHILNDLNKSNDSVKVSEVNVVVNNFIDAVEIKVDKQVSMKELEHIINKSMKTDDFMDKIVDGTYLKKEEVLIFANPCKCGKCKDIVLNISKWDMSKGEKEIFITNFMEFLDK